MDEIPSDKDHRLLLEAQLSYARAKKMFWERQFELPALTLLLGLAVIMTLSLIGYCLWLRIDLSLIRGCPPAAAGLTRTPSGIYSMY